MSVDDLRLSASNYQRMVAQHDLQLVVDEAQRDPDRLVRLELPHDLLGVFARGYESSAPLTRLPLYAIATIGVLHADPPHDPGVPEALVHYPLGCVGADHVGYGSFDLAVLRTGSVIDAFIAARRETEPDNPLNGPTVLGLRRLWVFPFLDPTLAVDALAKGDIGPHVIALRIELDEATLAGRTVDQPMAAMQNPSIRDWRLSPGSFTVGGALLVGHDGCETILPSNLSTQQFRFSQVARLEGDPVPADSKGRADRGSSADRLRIGTAFRVGHILEYTSEWFSLGHSLGKILYSLPLAPGEVTKLAIVDWSRGDSVGRAETTGVKENLQHDLLRDRTVEETVHAVLDEWQRGGSIMGGAAASGSYGAFGGAAALGGAYTTSSGTRELAGDTSQRIADSFHQASSSMRELRSTVVIQGQQAESSALQTRVVANYNHCHALTILYYEVLRHHRVVTRLASDRPALLVSYAGRMPSFDDDQILAHRGVLEAALLDERLRPAFDSINNVRIGTQQHAQAELDAANTPAPTWIGEKLITRLHVTFWTGSGGSGGTDANPWMNLKNRSGSDIRLSQIGGSDNGDAHHFGKEGYDDFEQGDVDQFDLSPDSPIKWKDIRGFVLGLDSSGGDWRVDRIKLEGFTSDNELAMLFDQPVGQDLPDDAQLGEFVTTGPPAAPAPPEAPPLETFVKPADLVQHDLLVQHLKTHPAHYARALWLAEDPNDRAMWFETITVGGQPLLDLIENRAVETSGTWVAFPIAPHQIRRVGDALGSPFPEDNLQKDSFVEQLLTLPTRGVFAEAKLGNCGCCETIEEGTLYDWGKYGIPILPPGIADLSAASRYQTPASATPTALPAPVATIQQPGVLPDPSAMEGALKLLGTSNIFRDMSAAAEVGELLGKLSDNATKIANDTAQRSDARDQSQRSHEHTKDLIEQIKDLNLPDESTEKLIAEVLKAGAGKAPAANQGGQNQGGQNQGGQNQGGQNQGGQNQGGQNRPATSTAPATPRTNPVTPPVDGPSNKPQAASPAPAPSGIGMRMTVLDHNVASAAHGTASLWVVPTGPPPAIPSGEAAGYQPGQPGQPIPAIAPPEQFPDRALEQGVLAIQTRTASAPGDARAQVHYETVVVDKARFVGEVLAGDDPAATAALEARTVALSGSVSYGPGPAGSIVFLEATPEVKTAVITGPTGESLAAALAGAVGNHEILDAVLTNTVTDPATNVTTRTYALTYLTGELTITQT